MKKTITISQFCWWNAVKKKQLGKSFPEISHSIKLMEKVSINWTAKCEMWKRKKQKGNPETVQESEGKTRIFQNYFCVGSKRGSEGPTVGMFQHIWNHSCLDHKYFKKSLQDLKISQCTRSRSVVFPNKVLC